jgi:diacylglycerol O-acyltransferase
MADIAAVRQVSGATVNDVVLTVLSAALRRYAELHKLKIKGRKLRIVVPVNVRSDGKSSDAGNQITFLPVDTPGDVREPLKLLALVQKRVKFSKTAHGAELIALAALVLAALPPSLQSLAGAVLSRLKISLCNSICTNVPGPRTPLYLLGHKMLSSYPYVPIGGEMGMNCAVMSYNGTLFVGFTGDAHAIPDISSLANFFSESFVELREAVSGAIPKSTPPPRKARSAARKARAVPVSSVDATASETAAEAVHASV